MEKNNLYKKIQDAKLKVLEMCVNAGLGHLTSAYSCAEILAVLYYQVMKHDPKNPGDPNRDRFIMSKNHGSVMLYPILADLGYFPTSELGNYMQDRERLSGHSHNILPGIEFSGGSLGIGLGVGAGLAYALKTDNIGSRVFVLVGDGECYTGSTWEAAMFAAHNNLSNLTAIIDRNWLACTDFTENILRLEPFSSKWQAFGWDVKHVDGHNIEALLESLQSDQNAISNKPLVIIADTVKGKGIDFMEGDPFSHGQIPKAANVEKAYACLRGETV